MAIRHPRDSRRTDRGFQWQSFHPARAAQRKASVDGFGRGRTDRSFRGDSAVLFLRHQRHRPGNGRAGPVYVDFFHNLGQEGGLIPCRQVLPERPSSGGASSCLFGDSAYGQRPDSRNRAICHKHLRQRLRFGRHPWPLSGSQFRDQPVFGNGIRSHGHGLFPPSLKGGFRQCPDAGDCQPPD